MTLLNRISVLKDVYRLYAGIPRGVPPYMAYTGMRRWTAYGFRPLCPKPGIQFRTSLS